MRIAERKVYIAFEAHPIRVCFLFFFKKPSKMTATTTLLKNERGDAMKRLKNKILSMEPDTTTYKAMYEGSMTVIDPAHPTMAPYVDYSSTYYNESIGFDISTTHKLAQDKPTVLITIPCTTLGIDIP
ncbi:MAG: hypothetical protein II373_05180, partial [Clostridia bacterium]|nr:hypothetical protein [Clostridia bacterium]